VDPLRRNREEPTIAVRRLLFRHQFVQQILQTGPAADAVAHGKKLRDDLVIRRVWRALAANFVGRELGHVAVKEAPRGDERIGFDGFWRSPVQSIDDTFQSQNTIDIDGGGRAGKCRVFSRGWT